MRQLEKYRFRDGVTPLNADTFNSRFFDIDARIHTLEQLKISWEKAISEVRNFAAERLNIVLAPAQDTIDSLTQQVQDLISSLIAYEDRFFKALIFGIGEGRFFEEVTYDANGTPQEINFFTDSARTQLIGSIQVTYDQNGNPTQIDYTIGQTTYRQTVSYDANGNPVSITQEVLGV
jgi:uncharacterized coiled-coil protein SlyX